MDFSLTEEQQDLKDLARRILGDRTADLNHLKAIERSDDGWDRSLWEELAAANIVGATVPESQGGLGFGFVDACLLLQEQGRHVAPVPLIHPLVTGLVVSRHGAPGELELLSDVATGRRLAVVAFEEYGTTADDPQVRAKPDGEEWRLEGTKTAVPYVHAASVLFVPAAVDGGDVAVFAVDPAADGVTARRQQVMNHEPRFEVHLDGVVAEGVVGGDLDRGRAVLDAFLAHYVVGYCALASGVSDRALALTAQYTNDRKQFDRPIGTFQAVGQRLGDCYIDNMAMELTMLAAASHIADGRPDPLEIGTAKFWASDGGSRVVHAALHVHGGISIDVDFPIHRYFLWMKTIENALGGATPHLLRMGEVIAAQPA